MAEHGIEGGAYDNMAKLAYGNKGCVLFCLCGFTTEPAMGDSWEDAGALLDDHLLVAQ